MDEQLYTSRAEIENYTLTTIEETFLSQLNLWIASISKQIMQSTGRQFKANETASSRLFSGCDSVDLLIDDCITVTLVEEGDYYGDNFSTVVSTGYRTMPLNHTALGVPIRKLHRKDSYWDRGVGNIRVTGRWGWSENVPDDIRLAATILVAGVINATRKDNAEIKSEKIGNYTVSYQDEKGWNDFEQVKTILDSYRKLEI